MDFEKIWVDLQARGQSVLARSDILIKKLLLVFIVVGAFVIRVLGFVRFRGKHELDDIFNLGVNEQLSHSGVNNFFKEEYGDVTFPGLNYLICGSEFLLNLIGFPLSDQALYTLSGPLFAALTTYITFHIAKSIKDDLTGLLAAGIVAILPGFFSISVDGRAGNVVAGLFAASLCILFFIDSLQQGSVFLAIFAGLSYALLSSLWSGYIFILYIFSAYLFAVIAFDRLSSNDYKAFTIFYAVGTAVSLFLPVFGFKGFLYLEQFPGLAIFLLVQFASIVPNAKSLVMPIGAVIAIVFVGIWFLGILAPSSGFKVFLSQVTAGKGSNWVTFFKDLHLIVFLFPAGIIISLKKRDNPSFFVSIYAIGAVLLASFSSQFIPFVFPIAATLASISVLTVIKSYLRHQQAAPTTRVVGNPVNKEISFAVLAGVLAICGIFFISSLSAASHYSAFTAENNFALRSQSSNALLWMDDFREASTWIKYNTPSNASFFTWNGGYGQAIVSLYRNNVLGSKLGLSQNTQKAQKIFLEDDEEKAAAALSEVNADYVLVVFGGRTGYVRDDINRVRMEIVEEIPTDKPGSLLFNLSYHGFSDVVTRPSMPGLDLARGKQMNEFKPKLTLFDEVFTSEHWVVRIFKLNKAELARRVTAKGELESEKP